MVSVTVLKSGFYSYNEKKNKFDMNFIISGAGITSNNKVAQKKSNVDQS